MKERQAACCQAIRQQKGPQKFLSTKVGFLDSSWRRGGEKGGFEDFSIGFSQFFPQRKFALFEANVGR